MAAEEQIATPSIAQARIAWKEWRKGWLIRNVPILSWLGNYNRDDLPSDAVAGIVIAITLIPQAMAYATLAGLPPQMGLYTSIFPAIAYAALGSSRILGIGPVAIISLMVGSSLAPFAAVGSPQYVNYAIILSLMSGFFLLLLGVLRAGALTNFMSHPVIAGFSTAAALIIAATQFGHMLGLELSRTYFIPKVAVEVFAKRADISVTTTVFAALSLILLVGRNGIADFLKAKNILGTYGADMLPKAMPLVVVVLATAAAWWFDLASKGLKVVGHIPSGLPVLVMPDLSWDVILQLAPVAALIAAVSFLESISIARTLAAKVRQKLLPDQELIGLGAANVASALTGGYPVAGSFSRSTVNLSSGARTQLAAIITSLLIAITLLALTPLLYHLPQATLAAIVVMAVTSLIDFSPLSHTWRYMKLDATSFLLTFLGVLAFGVEEGIIIGIASSIAFFLWRTSAPNFVVLGRLGSSALFRDARFHEVGTYPEILFLRIDMSLYFANAANLEDFVLRYVAEHPEVKHFVLVGSSVNMIDASALDTLESLRLRLKDSEVTMHLASIKSTILRRMRATDFLDKLAPGKVFLSPHDAAIALANK